MDNFNKQVVAVGPIVIGVAIFFWFVAVSKFVEYMIGT